MGGSSSKNEERINERKTNHATAISENSTETLFNSIVRISFTLNENDLISGIGFFIKFKLNNETRYFLMTCYHIIEEGYINKKITIPIYYGKVSQEIKLEIELDRSKRYIRSFGKPFDVTLIEILEKDKIGKDKFLVPDWNYKNGYEFYTNKNNDFYLAGYPQDNSNKIKRSTSSGKITKILKKPKFEHSLDSSYGNSGSPNCIINKDNLFVVGIHKQGHKTEPINYGTFLGYILDILEKGSNQDKHLNTIKLLENLKSIKIIRALFSNLEEKIK